MSNKEFVLRIYCLNQPLLTTEWHSIFGDKFVHSLPFRYALTEDIQEASVIAWDGVITTKMNRLMPELEAALKGKILMLMGEAQTSLQHHPFVKLFKPHDLLTIQLPGWSVLPEEILAALESCYKKITHV